MKKIISVMLCIFMLAGIFSVVSSAEKKQTARIVKTVYPVEDTVIADIVVTEAPYNLDNTGKADCTAGLQQAIDDCAANGGGTVFMPVGKYRLTGSIAIKGFVTLQGDWQNPEVGTAYGTVIIADVPSVDAINPALFNIGGCAGAVGLTVYYPNQSIENVKPYPYTFYVDGNGTNYMLQTLKNCTLLNSYRGIGGSAECANGNYECHEMFSIENVYATCLYRGLTSYNSADVDTVKTLVINAKYWANAGEEYNAPSIEQITDYTRKNLVGLSLGDLEWPEFADVHISDCVYGIRTEKGLRYCFSGTFYDLYIENCDYGLYCPAGTVTDREKQYGIGICNGKISGSKMAVYNPGENCIMLTNVKTDGLRVGKNIYYETASTEKFTLDYTHTHTKPTDNLYIVNADKTGKTDASGAVQKKLDEAAVTGGIVYLPAGLYRFDGPISVPSGVELRGSSSIPNRCQLGSSKGTLILAYYGYEVGGEKAEPLISVNGDNAGVSGIRISYFKNQPVDESGDYTPTSPAIKVTGKHDYVMNCFVVMASDAIVIENSEDVYLKKNVGCCYSSFISAENSTDVFIEGCLQNGNAVPRTGYSAFDIAELQNWMSENFVFDYVFIPITRKNTEFITLKNCDAVTVFNTFIYGGKNYLVSENSNAFICNTGSDGSAKGCNTFVLTGGEITVINAMRSTSDGQETVYAYETDGSTKLRIYNRLPVDIDYREFTVLQNIPASELNLKDLITVILQPLFRIYEAIGKKSAVGC